MKIIQLSMMVAYVTFATGLVLLSPGYKEVWMKWDELIGKPLEEARYFLEVVFPGATLQVFKSEDAYTMPCFNQIKVLIDDDDIVVKTPEFVGEEPDFSPLGDLVGKSYIEVHDLIRDAFKEKIVIKRQDSDESITSMGNSSSDNYILLVVSHDLTVSEHPQYIRVMSTRDDNDAEKNSTTELATNGDF